MARSRLSGDRSVRYHDIIYIIRGIRPFAKKSDRSIAICAASRTGIAHEPSGASIRSILETMVNEPALSSSPIISDHFWVGSSPRKKPNSDQVAR